MDREQLRAAATSRHTPRDPEGPGHPPIDTASIEAASTGTVPAAGHSGLDTALKLRPLEVTEALRRARLRGRGGADHPAAEKWRACHDAASDEKCFICNGVDADPQARTGKTLFGCKPHAVGEALAQMQHHGLLGGDVVGSGFSCYIHVREIAPLLVIGKETALIRALEGRQPLPYLRFDHPAVKGLNDKPTLVNSAETLANVSAVFQGQWPSGQHGTEPCAGPSDSATNLGTKVVTVCGDGIRAR